jgi:geranylgeranyl diphosphate synthase type II
VKARARNVTGESVRALLAEYGAVVRTGVEHYLAGGEPRRHLYDLAADYPRRGGRSLRGSLCVATARAFGAPAELAWDSAVSLEILHNAFLVHDDVEDESDLRRGRPTLHVEHGVPLAVNVGDALAVLGLRPLIHNFETLGPARALRILDRAATMARESVEGQAIELGWRRDNVFDIGQAGYLEMILKKTCWYTTIYPCVVGAIIGGAGDDRLQGLARYGFFLGAAFQIQDDLLNLLGNEARYGKELGGDLWEGKRTVMMLHFWERATAAEKKRLRAIYAGPRASRHAKDVAWVQSRFEAYESLAFAKEMAHGLAGAAQLEATRALAGLPESRDRAFIDDLPVWVLART